MALPTTFASRTDKPSTVVPQYQCNDVLQLLFRAPAATFRPCISYRFYNHHKIHHRAAAQTQAQNHDHHKQINTVTEADGLKFQTVGFDANFTPLIIQSHAMDWVGKKNIQTHLHRQPAKRIVRQQYFCMNNGSVISPLSNACFDRSKFYSMFCSSCFRRRWPNCLKIHFDKFT